MRVIGIDPGIVNLAMVVADVDPETKEIKVTHAEMINLTREKCTGGCAFTADDKSIAHRFKHFVDRIQSHLSSADVILCERQPPAGAAAIVEGLLGYFVKERYSNGNPKHFRLLSPNTAHAQYKMSSSKVERRLEVVTDGGNLLHGHVAFDSAAEKDHLSDALMYIRYYVDKILPKEQAESKINPFESFTFLP